MSVSGDSHLINRPVVIIQPASSRRVEIGLRAGPAALAGQQILMPAIGTSTRAKDNLDTCTRHRELLQYQLRIVHLLLSYSRMRGPLRRRILHHDPDA